MGKFSDLAPRAWSQVGKFSDLPPSSRSQVGKFSDLPPNVDLEISRRPAPIDDPQLIKRILQFL